MLEGSLEDLSQKQSRKPTTSTYLWRVSCSTRETRWFNKKKTDWHSTSDLIVTNNYIDNNNSNDNNNNNNNNNNDINKNLSRGLALSVHPLSSYND